MGDIIRNILHLISQHMDNEPYTGFASISFFAIQGTRSDLHYGKHKNSCTLLLSLSAEAASLWNIAVGCVDSARAHRKELSSAEGLNRIVMEVSFHISEC